MPVSDCDEVRLADDTRHPIDRAAELTQSTTPSITVRVIISQSPLRHR